MYRLKEIIMVVNIEQNNTPDSYKWTALSVASLGMLVGILAIWMFVNSFGSGLFQPPNTSAIMSSVSPQRRGVASSMRAFFNSAGMVLSMGISFPLIMGTIPLNEMMNMFVVGGANMPVAVQEAFTGGITGAFILSSIITAPSLSYDPHLAGLIVFLNSLHIAKFCLIITNFLQLLNPIFPCVFSNLASEHPSYYRIFHYDFYA